MEEITQPSKYKLLILITGIQILSFATGLYAGHTYWPKKQIKAVPVNYTTDQSANNTLANQNKDTVSNTIANESNNECPIKGSKSKIYHLKGGAFYERTNAAQCFNTEAEAQAAGYRKSSR